MTTTENWSITTSGQLQRKIQEHNEHIVQWTATLSNGDRATEETGDWTTIPGERKPWVRLATFAEENDLHLTSLSLKVDDRTIHLPADEFSRFGLSGQSPDFYSLVYHLEVDDVLGAGQESYFIDLTAHYDDLVVHYIQDTTEATNSWIVVTRGDEPLAPTPRKK